MASNTDTTENVPFIKVVDNTNDDNNNENNSNKETTETDSKRSPTSHAIFAMVTNAVGCGILEIPHVLAHGGMLIGFGLGMAAMAICTYICASAMSKSMFLADLLSGAISDEEGKYEDEMAEEIKKRNLLKIETIDIEKLNCNKCGAPDIQGAGLEGANGTPVGPFYPPENSKSPVKNELKERKKVATTLGEVVESAFRKNEKNPESELALPVHGEKVENYSSTDNSTDKKSDDAEKPKQKTLKVTYVFRSALTILLFFLSAISILLVGMQIQSIKSIVDYRYIESNVEQILKEGPTQAAKNPARNPNAGSCFYEVIAATFILGSLAQMRGIDKIARISIVGVMSIFSIFLLILISGFLFADSNDKSHVEESHFSLYPRELEKVTENGIESMKLMTYGIFSGMGFTIMLQTLGTCVMNFAFVVSIPSVQGNMKKRSNGVFAVAAATLAVFLFYGSVGLAGLNAVGPRRLLTVSNFPGALRELRKEKVMVFKDEVIALHAGGKSEERIVEILENEIPQTTKGFDIVLILLAIAVILNLLIGYPIFMHPVNLEAEKFVKSKILKMKTETGDAKSPHYISIPVRILTSIAASGVVFAAGCREEALGPLISFVGGILNSFVSFIGPCLIHLAISRKVTLWKKEQEEKSGKKLENGKISDKYSVSWGLFIAYIVSVVLMTGISSMLVKKAIEDMVKGKGDK